MQTKKYIDGIHRKSAKGYLNDVHEHSERLCWCPRCVGTSVQFLNETSVVIWRRDEVS